MTALAPGIVAFLREVARRQALVHAMRETGIFVAVVAIGLLVLLAGTTLLQPGRAVLVVAAVVLGLSFFGLAVRLLVVTRRLRDRAYLAQLVGACWPDLRSDLLSTVELGRELSSGGQDRFSRAMYAALVVQIGARLSRVSPRAIAPASRLRPAAALLSVSAIAWALTATWAPDRLRAGASALLLPAAARDIAAQPLLADLQLTYVYPAYMRRKTRRVDASTGQVSAPLGTRIRIRARSIVPLLSATLVVAKDGGLHAARGSATAAASANSARRDDRGRPAGAGPDGRAGEPQRRLRLSLEKPHSISGQMTVDGDGRYHFEVRTIDDRVLRDPVQHLIEVEPDAPPRALLHGHPDDIEVTARQRIEIGYTVEDDHGVSAVDLAYQVTGQPVGRTQLWRPPSSSSRHRISGKADWDLAALDLRPGARVAYWVEALDNDTVSGPKRATSGVGHLKVFSPEDRQRQILELQQQVAEQTLRVLADRLLLFGDEPAEPLKPALRLERVRVAHRAQAALVDSVRDLRNRMRENKLFPDSVFRAVSAMRMRLGSLTVAESRLLRGIRGDLRRSAAGGQVLQPLRTHNEIQVAELERDALLLADLLHEQQLQALFGLQSGLRHARQRLADLLQRYHRSRDERLRQEIVREIRYMQQQLQQLLAQLSKLRATIPDEYLNVEAVETLRLDQTLAQLSAALQQGDLNALQATLRSLDQNLFRLRDLLGGNLQEYRSGRMGQREQAYGQLLDELRGLEVEQRGLASQTGQVVERYRRQAARLLKSRIAPFIQQQQARLQRLRRQVNEVDRHPLASYQQEQLARIKKRVEGLRSMLRLRDVDQALNMAQRTNNALRTLRDDMVEDLQTHHGHGRARLQRALHHTRRAQTRADELERALESVFPEASALLSPEDRQQLHRLRRRQQQLRRNADQLASKLLRQPDGSVGVPQVPRGLREATRLMDAASGKLGAIRPQQAHGDQRAATDRLISLQQQLRQTREPRGGGSHAASRERVKIPGAESFSPPREFRQDILEAMKEQPPAAFRRQVKRYYEELVR